MSEVRYTCNYCDYKWERDISISNWMSTRDLEEPKCAKCGDTKIKIVKKDGKDKTNVFGYEE